MSYITLPPEKVFVKYKTQIVVLGGGPSGISAAVSAARNGSEVILIEKCGYLGGQATGGLVIVLCGLNDSKERIIKGFCQDTLDYLETFNATKPWHGFIIFDPELLKRCFDHFIEKHKIKLLLNTYATGAITDNGKIKNLIIESKSGKLAIETDFVIDCTGDADSLTWCDENYEQATKEKARPVTACFRAGGVDVNAFLEYKKNHYQEYRETALKCGLDINPLCLTPTYDDNFIWFDMGHVHNIDITDIDDLTKGEIEARKLSWKIFEHYKENIVGFENAYITDIAPLLGIRDSRRLKGEYFITESDYGKTFEDNIAFAPYYYTGKGAGRLQITLRALIPKKINNLLVAGRAIGIEHKLIDCIREIPCCYATGQAAGLAASIAIADNKDNKNINIKILQNKLISQGAYI